LYHRRCCCCSRWRAVTALTRERQQDIHTAPTRASYTLIHSNGPGLAAGNSFISSSDVAGGGHQDAYCVLSERRGTELCTVTLLLPRGQLSGQGVFVNGPTSSGTIALLSGTGAYSGAVGTLTTSGLTAHHETLTVRLG